MASVVFQVDFWTKYLLKNSLHPWNSSHQHLTGIWCLAVWAGVSSQQALLLEMSLWQMQALLLEMSLWQMQALFLEMALWLEMELWQMPLMPLLEMPSTKNNG
jgi:hypothetical protein